MHTSQIPAAFAARKGIDLAAPGGVEALLEFHRGFFGDATMQEDSDGDGQQGDPAASADGQEPAGDGDEEPGHRILRAVRVRAQPTPIAAASTPRTTEPSA